MIALFKRSQVEILEKPALRFAFFLRNWRLAECVPSFLKFSDGLFQQIAEIMCRLGLQLL